MPCIARLRLRFERGDEAAVFDHVGERLARFDLAGEGQKGRPHGVIEPAVGDNHVEDRLRLAGDRLPDAERVQQPPRRRDDRRGAFVAGWLAPSAGSATVTENDGPSPCRSAEREREPGKAAAGDQHIAAAIVRMGHQGTCSWTAALRAAYSVAARYRRIRREVS